MAETIVTIAVEATYDYQIKLFWDEIRDEWAPMNALLAEDPRNDQAK